MGGWPDLNPCDHVNPCLFAIMRMITFDNQDDNLGDNHHFAKNEMMFCKCKVFQPSPIWAFQYRLGSFEGSGSMLVCVDIGNILLGYWRLADISLAYWQTQLLYRICSDTSLNNYWHPLLQPEYNQHHWLNLELFFWTNPKHNNQLEIIPMGLITSFSRSKIDLPTLLITS